MKMFPDEVRGLVPFSLWGSGECGTNDDAKRHLMSMFTELEAFATPKPEPLLSRIIHIATDPGDLVLDFFAGSGTTPAVAHKMGRRWIAAERSASTVSNYLIPRLDRVVRGADPAGVTEAVSWTEGGDFGVLAVGAHAADESLATSVQAYFALAPDERCKSVSAVVEPKPSRRKPKVEAPVLSLFEDASEDGIQRPSGSSGSVVA